MIHMESLVKSTGHVVLGPTAQQLKSHGCRLGRKKLEYATIALKQFRLLVEQLARVDPSQWSYNEELAFWIKLYNALIMHAYLAYGVPKKTISNYFPQCRRFDAAAYTVGGLSVSAADIECTILKMNPATYRPQIAVVLALQNVKASDERLDYTIDHHEPFLYFALSCGLHSPPAVRIFRPRSYPYT